MFFKRFSLPCLILIFSLGLVGIGFAAWNDSITLNAGLTTGSIRPVFKEANLFKTAVGCGQGKDEGFDKKVSEVEILNNGKHLWVKIENAHHGDVYYLNYLIENKGSLPFNIAMNPVSSDKALEVRNLQTPKEVLAGRNTWGQVEIYVNASKLSKDYQGSFMVVLDCHQTGLL